MADGSAEAAFFTSLRAPEQTSAEGEAVVNGLDVDNQIEDDDEYDPPDNELPDSDPPALNSTPAVSSTAPTPVPEIDQQPLPTSTPAPLQHQEQQEQVHQLQQQQPAAMPSVESHPAAALPKARLPHDRIGILEDRIAADEKGDLQAWLELIEEQRRRGKLDEVRKVYDRFFEVFPMAADEYESLINLENEAGNKQKVEAIFSKILTKIPSLKTWSLYLNHVRRYFNIQVDRTGKASQTVHAAYQAVLDHVGGDPDSGSLWMDYITFVKTGPGVVGGTSWQDGQKMDVLRRAYQQAIAIPHQQIETVWKEYTAFEMGINKQTARKFLQEKSPDYMTARGTYYKLTQITAGLTKTSLPRLPPAPGFDGYDEYMHQVGLWKVWIAHEKDDPLVLKEGEEAKLRKRIVYVYKQALMALYFWPEMWLEAAEFCFENELESQGNDFLAQGLTANPESALLAFRQADRLELSTTNGNDEDSKAARGDKVRAPYDKCLDALYALVTKVQAAEATQVAQIEAETVADGDTQPDASNDEENDDSAESPEVDEARKERQQRIDGVKAFAKMRNDQLYKSITFVWITMMRAFQRMQGKGKPGAKVLGSRGIFADARKRGRLTSELYSAAALLEYHSGEKDPGSRIFERGTKLFPKDEVFALEYIKFLVIINDTTNARVVFETTVSRLQSDTDPEAKLKAKPLFAYFRRFEAQYGELSQVMKLEDRMRVAFPDDAKLFSFSSRFIETEGQSNFDVTAVHQIISPASQAKPRYLQNQVPSISTAIPNSSPHPSVIQPVTYVSSPKRSLPDEFAETNAAPAAKVPRGESPLKGAAGRRMAAQASAMSSTPLMNNAPLPMPIPSGPPPLAPLPSAINYLLGNIPPASTYNATRLSADAMINLIRGLHVPANIDELNAIMAAKAQQQQRGGGMLQPGQGQQQQYWQGR